MIMELMIIASFVLAVFSYDESWSLFALGFFVASIIPWMIKEVTEWYDEEWRNRYDD
jgi:hypothetical protein